MPKFRCGCGAQFNEPIVASVPCRLYAANFGSSFADVAQEVEIADLWKLAPRLNKQLAILELDGVKVEQLLLRMTSNSDHPDELPSAAQQTFQEGARTLVWVNRYERDPRARRACLEHYGCQCWACGFDFEIAYGEIGRGFIGIHHLSPLGSFGKREVHPVNDLRPLCPNCHAIVHRRNPPLNVDEIRELRKRYTFSRLQEKGSGQLLQ